MTPPGQNLLKVRLLAAAISAVPITQVYTWLTRPHGEAPADIFRTAGFDLLANVVIGHIGDPEEQRAGVYGTARQMVSCLTDRDVSQWVTPTPGTTVAADPHPQFVPEDFLRGKGTLYSLSGEGVITAGPLQAPATASTDDTNRSATSRRPPRRLMTVWPDDVILADTAPKKAYLS